MNDKVHRDRVINELKQAGVTKYGLFRAESKYLPQLIHEGEHVGGVVYGRVGIDFVMLVATDRRVLYFQSKSLYSETDEVTYDVVSGVKSSYAVLFSSITLHTRVRDYKINFANVKCARNFVKYIESRRVERDRSVNYGGAKTDTNLKVARKNTDVEGISFLKEHDVAVLSTVDGRGVVSGAAVYYLYFDELIYIVTRSGTKKAQDMIVNNKVGLTVYEPFSLKTVQISGRAEVENSLERRKNIFDQMIRPRPYKDGEHYPPVTKMTDGSYTVIKITPLEIKYSDFSK